MPILSLIFFKIDLFDMHSKQDSLYLMMKDYHNSLEINNSDVFKCIIELM